MKKNLLFLLLAGCLFSQCGKEMAAVTTTGTGGSLARFAIAGDYLYIVDESNLNVIDISDAASPRAVQTIPVGFEIETIFPFKDKLFIGSTSVIHIFSLEDPSRPLKLSEAISPAVMRRCDPVVAKDSVAFATLRTNGPCGGFTSILAVYDITDVLNPVQKAAVNMGEPYGLGYSDSALYVCDKQLGLQVFNITDAFNPRFVTQIKEGSYIDVIPNGSTLICWEETGMHLFDITEPLDPVLIAKIQ